MNFKDTPEEAAFREKARAFLDTNARRKTEEDETLANMLAGEEAPADFIQGAKAWQKTLADNGWAVLPWPKEFGGQGLGPVEQLLFADEQSRYDVPTGIYTIGLGMIGPTIITHGTDEQKQRYLPPMIDGSEIWSQLWSEPNAGSDVASLQTRAERTSDGFVMNGQKVWTTGAHYSKWGLVIARTNTDVPKHRGISAFIVDLQGPGVEVRPLRQMNGGTGFNEVFFSDVQVPAENLVGDLNDGWRVALTTLMNERFAIGVGGMRGASIGPLLKLARKTDLHGRPAADDPVIRQHMAGAYIDAKLLQLTGARAISKISKGSIPGPEGSIMKIVGTKLATSVGAIGTEILGLGGVLVGKEAPDAGQWSMAHISAPGMLLAGGTTEIMKNIIGERVLGLPKEPSVDKDTPYRELKVGTTR